MVEEKDLDEEFRRFVSDMKPHAKVLPYKSEERHRVTLWIKKLLAFKTQKEVRNAYAKQLLKMLGSGKLEEPFTSAPPLGALRPHQIGPLSRDGETEVIIGSSPANTFSQPPKSVSALLSRPSPLMSSHRPGSKVEVHSPLKPTSQEQVSSSGTSKTAARQVRVANNFYLREGITRPSGSLAALVLTSPLHATTAATVRYLDTQSHKRGVSAHQPLKQVEVSPTFAGKGDETASQASKFTEGSSQALPRNSELGGTPPHDFHPSLTSSIKDKGDTKSVGVVLSHDHSGDDSVDYKPLSVCSDESFSDQSDEATQATPRPHPLSQSSVSPCTGGGKLSREILQQREMDLLLRSTETRHQEEKLRLQREHEDSIQQLLRRRTKELEEVREEGKCQLQQLQTRNKQLETTIAGLQRALEEQSHVTEGTSQHTPLHHQRHQLQTEFDKKLHKTITDFERQKLEQEQRHAKHVQQVVGDCGRRIDHMERDCASQMSTSAAVVAELEGRVQELTQQNTSISSEKDSLKKAIQLLEQKLQESHQSESELRGRVSSLQQEREAEKRQAETGMEARLKEKEKQHSLEEARLLREIRELEQQLKKWQLAQEEMRESHLKEMTEMERTVAGLQSSRRIAESQLGRMRTAQERQTQQAEVAVEQFKAQVEQQSNEVFSSLHGELERLAAELAECRLERDSSVAEWAKEKREERERVNAQLLAIEASHRHEKEELLSQHSIELDSQRKTMERAREQELSRLQRKISDLQTQTKTTATRTAKVVSSLEEKVQQLQQEAESQKSRHSRDCARLRKRIEEEKQTTRKMKDSAVSAVKVEWQEERKRARMTHQKEMNVTKDKHNMMIDRMEHNFATESAKLAEAIDSLQAQVKLLKTDIARQESGHKQQLAEAERNREEERAGLVQHHELMLQSVHEETDASQRIVSQLQGQLAQMQHEHESQLCSMRLQFQTSMSGMMPLAVRKEYDNTIRSLRSQIELLEQRRALLQHELEQLRAVLPSHHILLRHNTHSHTPSITS